MLPIRNGILASADGLEKIISIDKTLEKYSKYEATDLVKLAHQKNTPWSKSGAGSLEYQKIEDDCIIEYHKYEVIG